MLVLVTIALILIALLLLLRFVQPEFIYSVRRGLVRVAFNKAFIDKMAGRDDVDAAFKEALVSEDRVESRTNDEKSILDRITKISELYRLLDSRRKVAKSQKPQVCIVELGALLTNLGREIEANPEHNAPVMRSGALLKYIADGVLTSRNEETLYSENDVDRWFIENPISIEQAVELMIATVVALAHRRQAAKLPAKSGVVTESVDVWSEINKLEKRLQLFVRARLQQKYKVEHEISNRVKESLSEESYSECLARMEDVRRKRPGLALDFFDFVYWFQLQELILAEWDVFQPIFAEQQWLTTRVAHIVDARADEVRNEGGSDEERKVVVAYCRDIRKRIDRDPPR